MRVRDRTRKLNEFEGGWTYVRSALCPCRPCYNPRDHGHYNSQGKWVKQVECTTRQNNGCPLPPPKAKHVIGTQGLVCKRCGCLTTAPESTGG